MKKNQNHQMYEAFIERKQLSAEQKRVGRKGKCQYQPFFGNLIFWCLYKHLYNHQGLSKVYLCYWRKRGIYMKVRKDFYDKKQRDLKEGKDLDSTYGSTLVYRFLDNDVRKKIKEVQFRCSVFRGRPVTRLYI